MDDATKLKLSGVEVASFGDALATTEHALEVTRIGYTADRGEYMSLVDAHDLGHAETNARLPEGMALAYDGLSVSLPPVA